MTDFLLAVLTGSTVPPHDWFSTSNQMTVKFFTDSSGHGRGFRATFTCGEDLGSPGEITSHLTDSWFCQVLIVLVYEQLRVRRLSSSVRQEIVSMVTGNVTARSIVLMVLTKPTVVR